jgi:probable HAF family extracellular repeat protein
VPWKPIATAFAAVVFGIITYGGISAWQHRTVYGDKFTIVTAVPDTLDARQSLLNDNWSESAAAAAPDSARLLNAYCEVTATNSKGISVGTRLINGAFQAFENNGGNLQTLSTGPESGANSINDKGMVVGYTGQYTHHATLWLHGKMRDLNKTTPPTANLVLRDAVNINNAGTITATATDNLGNPLIVQLKPKY